MEPEQRCQVDEEDVHGTAYALPDSSIAADEWEDTDCHSAGRQRRLALALATLNRFCPFTDFSFGHAVSPSNWINIPRWVSAGLTHSLPKETSLQRFVRAMMQFCRGSCPCLFDLEFKYSANRSLFCACSNYPSAVTASFRCDHCVVFKFHISAIFLCSLPRVCVYMCGRWPRSSAQNLTETGEVMLTPVTCYRFPFPSPLNPSPAQHQPAMGPRETETSRFEWRSRWCASLARGKLVGRIRPEPSHSPGN